MDIPKEVIIDILENLSDDELRLFLEHLVDNNDFAKESLYKYYQGLMNNRFIEKNNYKERILNEIKIDKIHPYAFVSFYDLLNNSLNKFNKNNDDFLYELLFEAYIELSKKYSKVDFSDLFDYMNNIDTPLESKTLEIIISKIYAIRSRLYLKIDVLTKLLKYINKNDISIYLDCFFSIYEENDDKSLYLSLIDYLFIYFQKNFSKLKAIQFLEYFSSENYRINHTIVSFYKNNEEYEKALSILNKVNTSKISESEYKDYLINKGNIYKELGSNKLYFKSLVDLTLHNHFEYFDILKDEQEERDFIVTLDFIVDNLNINKTANLSLLHKVFKDNYCEYGLIKFYDKFDSNLIFEDILYFKDFDLNKATNLYIKHILELAKKCDTRPKLNALVLHIIDLKRDYKVKDFNKFLNELKPLISEFNFNFIYSHLLREFPR